MTVTWTMYSVCAVAVVVIVVADVVVVVVDFSKDFAVFRVPMGRVSRREIV